MICQGCQMNVPDNPDGTAGFHPHLHCVIWSHYKTDPNEVLTATGYVRAVDSAGSEYEKLIAEEDRIESEMIADGRLVVGEDGVARRPPSDNAGSTATNSHTPTRERNQ